MGSFGDNLSAGARYRSEQPIKTSLPSDEFDSPEGVLTDKFIVSFGDTQDFVDRLNPFAS